MDDLTHLLALNATERVGSVLLRRLLDRFRTLAAVAAAGERALAEVEGVGASTASEIRRAFAENAGERERDLAERHQVRLIPWDDPASPHGFRCLFDAPLVLSVRGSLEPEDAAAVSMVGTREATPYGLGMADRLAADLSECGLTIVSGLARGIDTAAHRGALRRGRTLAVLGTGVLRVYPEENEPLSRRIAASGALLSEFPLLSGPSAVHFPRRNRLIAALGLGTVVVESGDASGALITADWAMEHGKPVFAVPGPCTSPVSRGCHALIRQGAAIAACPDDILDEIGFSRNVAPLTPEEDRVLASLQSGPLSAAEISAETGLARSDVEESLSRLSRGGRARQEGEAWLSASRLLRPASR
ncbi:MAG: DNA-protecting protein DprA [Candidatus Brocadiae bacterium]|nr:DNA-protecting protein DprA [Candidatus Brocadiia bacterium]